MIRCLAALLCFFYLSANGQSAQPDSAENGPAATATAVLLQSLQAAKEIYNGPEHVEYLPTIEGVAYFETKAWQTGTVQYDGVVYRNELLQYDMAKNRLVIRRPDAFAVEVRNDKVDWFTIAGHFFMALHETNTAGLKPGFYDRLANGAFTLLAARHKQYEEKVEDTRVRRRFVEEATFYVVQNNKAHLTRSLRSLLDLTGRRRNEVQQQLKKLGIRYRDNHEAALVAAARYYNQTQP